MPTQYKKKKYKGYMINGSERLIQDLAYIRNRTHKPNRILLEEIFCPLRSILKRKLAGNYYVVVEDDQIIIRVYSRKPVYSSGKLTATLQDTIELVD
jgi:hypothetical protein